MRNRRRTDDVELYLTSAPASFRSPSPRRPPSSAEEFPAGDPCEPHFRASRRKTSAAPNSERFFMNAIF